uniref:Peptidase S1 domain-containing protein n=1 Tax=Megaselia scalaris TaxID=36166 RepID=T1H2J2_MEGSC
MICSIGVIFFLSFFLDFGSDTLIPQVYSHQNACKNLYPQGYVNEGVICANTDHGTKAACQGDFGGPLATRDGHLLGVSSFMSACGCEDGIPIGFARVSHYLDWIHEVSGISIE